MQTNEVYAKLNELKTKYYDDNGGKNIIFKKKQKMEIAQTICSQFDLSILLRKTIYLVNGTDIVFIDYKLFKLYANPKVYPNIVNYTLNMFDATIKKYGRYSVHIDVDTITPSATERYKEIIILFNQSCENTNFMTHLFSWVLYNTPMYIDTFLNIIKSIIDPTAIRLLKQYEKSESVVLLKELNEMGEDDEIYSYFS